MLKIATYKGTVIQGLTESWRGGERAVKYGIGKCLSCYQKVHLLWKDLSKRPLCWKGLSETNTELVKCTNERGTASLFTRKNRGFKLFPGGDSGVSFRLSCSHRLTHTFPRRIAIVLHHFNDTKHNWKPFQNLKTSVSMLFYSLSTL